MWPKGAIYIMGFEKGLRQWRKLLKPGGYLALTGLTRLAESPRQAVRSFWAEAYPAKQTVDASLVVIEACGYRLSGYFTQPASGWWADYYDPIAAKLPLFRKKHHANPAARAAADMELAEMALLRAYPHVYGYVFYTMRREESRP